MAVSYGKIRSCIQPMRSISSAIPRARDWTWWTWESMSPGMMILPEASIFLAPRAAFGFNLPAFPTQAIRSFSMRTAPFLMILRLASIVITVPLPIRILAIYPPPLIEG